jgi:hypothetical protein
MSTLGKVLLVFVFLASLGFLYLAARMMKTHDVFRTHYNEHVTALGDRDKKIKELEELQARITRDLDILAESQGRVWRDCPLSGRNADTITIQVGNPSGITGTNVLYVFEQHLQPVAPTPQQPVPYDPTVFENGIHSNNRALAFLGEFKVTQVQGNLVSLQSTRRLMASQDNALRNSPGPFACYEKLPTDQHGAWANLKKYLAERNRSDSFPRWFDATVDAAVVREFQRDGDKAIKADADKGIVGDPDERVLVELKFLTDYDKLTPAQQADLRGLNFNIVNLRTPAGDDVKDAEGKVVSVDISKVIQKDAIAYFMLRLPGGGDGPGRKLVDMGIAQSESQIYVRQLRDYGVITREVLAEIPILENRIKELDTNIAAKTEEKAKLEADNQAQLAIQKDLKAENDMLKAERQVTGDVVADAKGQLAQARELIAKFTADNKRLSLLLRQVQLLEAERINREAREKVTKEGN